jgi:hypothetical protein
MSEPKRKIVLNREVFSRRAHEVTALRVLGTLIHRFMDAGTFELFVFGDGSLRHRAPVNVSEGGPFQINIDMTEQMAERFHISPGGALGFFASGGSGQYHVRVDQIKGKERAIVLDSTKGIPAGDLYAVTLVRPGRYRVTDPVNKAEAVIYVDMPPRPEPSKPGDVRSASRTPVRYRHDQPTGLVVAKDEIKPREVKILAGQTVVFECSVPASIRVESSDPQPPLRMADKTDVPPRARYTFRKPGK